MPKAKILVVEDEYILASDLVDLLNHLGYQAFLAGATAREALSHVRREPPDLVLMDVRLKGDMDGIEAARIIRAEFHLPVIFLSAFASEAILERAKQSEPYGYLVKPAPAGELKAAVEMALYKAGMERRLKESETILRLVLDATSDGVWDLDLLGDQLVLSPNWGRMLGYAPGEISLDNRARRLIHPEDRPRNLAAWQDYLEGRAPAYTSEFRLRNKAGEWQWVLSRGKIVAFDDQGRPSRAVGTHTDISARKRAEEERRRSHEELEKRVAERTAELTAHQRRLRDMALELTRVEDQERRRLAADLHDSVCQSLALTILQLQLAGVSLADQQAGRRLEEAIARLEKTVADIRSLIIELSPPMLHELGLKSALEWLAEKMAAEHGLTVSVIAHESQDKLSDDLRAFLFRVARELLLNVVKHAGVDQAEIRLEAGAEELSLAVSDQGAGFDPAEKLGRAGPPAGFGLLSVRERLHSLGGRLSVESRPGQGARVSVQVKTRS